jgi:hypothetical protein
VTELEELREATREAHAAIKDLRAAAKEARTAAADARTAAQTEVRKILEAAAVREIGKLGQATEAAIARSVAKVSAEFDRLAATYTGTDPHSIRAGKASLEELANRAKARRG